MIGHEAIGMADPVIALIDMLDRIEKVLPVSIVLKDRFLLVASRGHMIHCTGIFDAERAGHEASIAEKREFCNKRDLTLRGPRVFHVLRDIVPFRKN